MLITNILHPDFEFGIEEWVKWRLAYEGGKAFIDAYLKQLSSREDVDDYAIRKQITYCPAFAKTGINEVKDSIYQRMVDITRVGGTKSYQNAITGLNGGVDLEGSSMNYFMGYTVLKELLVMKKVGVYVDMPPLNGLSLADNQSIRPYVYMYNAESIRCWICDNSANINEYKSVLLEEYVETTDEETGFPTGTVRRLRRVWRDDNGQIWICFYNDEGQMIDADGDVLGEPIPLNIDRIPFAIAEISESLMTDVADYQIALLNLASTDMIYAIKSNFPFYTEMIDFRTQSPHLRNPENPDDGSTKSVQVGTTKGRQYAKGLERPAFIHPSSEPLTVSMEKQEQLKSEIRLLLKLTISNLQGPKMASAESKKQDTQGLETGLSYIGLTLENLERKIAEFWSMYEGSKQIATVTYPETYSLRSEDDRINESKSISELLPKVPSLTFQKSMAKRIAKIMLAPKISREDYKIIEKEIDAAPAINNDYVTIQTDVEIGILDLELASKIRGYPEGTVEKAKKDHAERLARIAESQTKAVDNAPAARGLAISDPNPNSGKDEKKTSRDTTTDASVADKTRGDGK